MIRAILSSALASLVFFAMQPRTEAGIIQVPGQFGPDSNATQILQISPFGETFTAVEPFIQSAGFNVRDLNPTVGPDDFTLTISIYADGLNNLLAQGAYNGLTPGFDGPISVSFSPSIGPLVAGNIYTVIISDITGRWGVETADSDSAYVGGHPVATGAPFDGADLSLSVVSTAAVPTPSALKLGGMGAICMMLLAIGRSILGSRRRIRYFAV